MKTGTLTLVSTPLGNLGDLTARARLALTQGTYFLAEDTRALFKLLSLLEIGSEGKVIKSFHEHNRGAIEEVIGRLREGGDVYLVSDAGSPLLCDPAYPLVTEVIKADLPVDTLPGATSVVAALELSGLAPMPFTFIGFLAREAQKKRAQLADALALGTVVCFESPHRIERTLEELSADFPDTDVAICREITKKFQSVHRFKARDYGAQRETLTIKGEFVLVLSGEEDVRTKAHRNLGKLESLAQGVLERPSSKNLSKLLSEILSIEGKEIYKLLTENSR